MLPETIHYNLDGDESTYQYQTSDEIRRVMHELNQGDYQWVYNKKIQREIYNSNPVLHMRMKFLNVNEVKERVFKYNEASLVLDFHTIDNQQYIHIRSEIDDVLPGIFKIDNLKNIIESNR